MQATAAFGAMFANALLVLIACAAWRRIGRSCLLRAVHIQPQWPRVRPATLAASRTLCASASAPPSRILPCDAQIRRLDGLRCPDRRASSNASTSDHGEQSHSFHLQRRYSQEQSVRGVQWSPQARGGAQPLTSTAGALTAAESSKQAYSCPSVLLDDSPEAATLGVQTILQSVEERTTCGFDVNAVVCMSSRPARPAGREYVWHELFQIKL